MKRDEVEFLHDGQALQHMLAAVPVQHRAHWKKEQFKQVD